jgi:hypothetical protein
MKKRLAVGLPDVIDCRDREDETPRFTVLVTADIRNRLAFEFEYRTAFEGRELGQTLQVRQIFADDYEVALYRLRKFLAGFGVRAILLYAVRAPVTPKELAFLDHVNRQLSDWRANGSRGELVFA